MKRRHDIHLPRGRRGFTLIEVLVTLVFLAIVLPALMRGIGMTTQTADRAKKRTNATVLGQSKLAELAVSVSTGQAQNGSSSGNFDGQWSAYRWEAAIQNWAQDNTSEGIQEIDLKVSWDDLGSPRSITLSTLAYPRTQ
jgi:type II secretion system protein I